MMRMLLMLVAAAVLGGMPPAAEAALQLTSPTIGTDDGKLATENAGPGPCGGKDLSPALAWSGTPAGTASFAITIFDQDGQKGQGVSHWVAYGIAPTVTSIPTGFGSAPSPAYVGGNNTRGVPLYTGACPPVGDAPHHYLITLYALDLAPSAPAPGLTRDTFFPAIKGHVLGVTSFVGTYAR
jgi:Raf kinase inhibitor-like YbhB/YbcL family protein